MSSHAHVARVKKTPLNIGRVNAKIMSEKALVLYSKVVSCKYTHVDTDLATLK
jgi:hypothetical protein